MKKNFVPRVFLGAALISSMALNSHAFFGDDDLTDEQKKAKAEKFVKDTAETAAKAAVLENLAKLLKVEFGSEASKELIKSIATDLLPTLEIKEEDGKNTMLKTIMKEMQDQYNELATSFKEFKESPSGQSAIKTVLQVVKEQKEAIKKAWKSGSEEDEVHVKALTTTASVVGNQHALDVPEIGQLAHRKLSLYDLFPKFPVGPNNNGVVRYYDWDEATTVRAATLIAEGEKFPESTAKWKVYTTSLKKIGDSIPMTEEFMYDDEMFAAELEAFLLTNVDLVVDTELYSGDNTGNHLLGIKNSIPTYVPAPSSVQDASIYDLVPVVKASITKTRGSKFAPNVVLMNIGMINKYKLKKDANNNYVMPPFVSRDGNQIDGSTVFEINVMNDNEMIIGDSRFARIYEQPGIFIGRGMVDDDFLRDQNRLKVRRRLLFLIRNSDKGGWALVSDVDAALAVIEEAAIPVV